MFWRLVVEYLSDQEIRQASLEGEYTKKEKLILRTKKENGLVIGVT